MQHFATNSRKAMQRIGSEETIPSTPQSPKKVTLAPLPGVGSPAGSSSPTTSFKEGFPLL